jgi:hypothetical protein
MSAKTMRRRSMHAVGALAALVLTLSLASGAAGQSVPLVFVGNGGTPYLVDEGGGTKTVTIPVTLNQSSSTQVTVDWQTQSAWFPRTASDSGFRRDYQAAGGTVVFAPGQTTKTVTISIFDDLIAEEEESFVVALSNPVGAQIGIPPDFWTHGAVVTIHDNELGVFIGEGGAVFRAPEGDSGTTPFEVSIRLNFASASPVTVDWATRDALVNDPQNAATADQDYEAANGAVTFAPGETEKTVAIQIIGDTVSESPEEEFAVSLTRVSGALLGVPWDDFLAGATIGIQDDDPADISIDDVSVNEGDAGTTNATFTVTRSSLGNDTYPNPVTVDWVAEDVTAHAGSDFIAASGTVTFGGLTETVEVPVVGDTATEGNETFRVRLSNPQNAVITDSVGTGTIVDDDQPTRGTLIVITNVINDNGGTLGPSDFAERVLGNNPNPASFTGQGPPGRTVTLDPGGYSVGITPTGYVISQLSPDCGGTIAAGETKTCTITADDQPTRGTLIVITNVINDNGGTLGAADFTLEVGGTNPSPATSTGIGPPGRIVTLGPGAYTVDVFRNPNGYSITHSAGCLGTIAAGDTKTCTITADDPDRAPPAITCGSADGLWHAANVSINCTARDSGSGLANPADAAFSLSTTVPDGAEDANAATDSRQICDVAGNCAPAGPIGGNKVDRAIPFVTITTPFEVDATSPAGAIVTYLASARDGADPNPTMTCVPPSGSLFPIGSTEVPCTATDHVGNTNSNGHTRITVRGAKQQLTNLIQKVLNATALPSPLKLQLIARMQSLVTGFDPANATQRQAVCAALRAFVAAVQLLSGHGITPAQAAEWTADANRIRAVLAC